VPRQVEGQRQAPVIERQVLADLERGLQLQLVDRGGTRRSCMAELK
jgi:hypothetical protein